MRRRLLCAASTLALTAGLTVSLASAAQAATVTATVDGVVYTADTAAPAAGATVLQVTGDAPANLDIPASVAISGAIYPVRVVAQGAAEEVGLTGLTLPTTLTTIGASAFAGNALTTLALPDSVTSIASGAFAQNALASLDISDNLAVIDENVFGGNDLVRVKLPDSTTTVASNAFGFNPRLVTVTFPASVTSIGDGAFAADNAFAAAVFAGPAPADFTASVQGDDDDLGTVGSLGDGQPTIYYRSENAGAGGFTSPTYMGYPSQVGLDPNPATLNGATAGTAYDQQLTGSGGTAPYRFTAKAGSLPAGLSLGASGRISGTPTASGTFRITVTLTDSAGSYGSRTYTLTVATPTISIAPASLAGAAQGARYSQQLTASGGVAPYTFAVTSGALPAGLNLSPSGLLSGTPAGSGTTNFTVTATDSTTGTGPATASRAYSLGVTPAAGSTTPVPVPTISPINEGPARPTITKLKRSKDGGVFELTIIVVNKSTVPSRETRVRVANQPKGIVYPRRTVRLGTLDPGERGTATLRVKPANRPRTLKVQARARNGEKDVRTVKLPGR